jgi:hypothetical protein
LGPIRSQSDLAEQEQQEVDFLQRHEAVQGTILFLVRLLLKAVVGEALDLVIPMVLEVMVETGEVADKTPQALGNWEG